MILRSSSASGARSRRCGAQFQRMSYRSGFGDAKATGRALAAAMFERWEFDLTSDDYKPYRKFLKRLEK